jgi:hypothetical protein
MRASPVDMEFAALRDSLASQFLQEHSPVASLLEQPVLQDLALVFNYLRDGATWKLHFGPVSAEELKTGLFSDFRDAIAEFPKTAFFADLDCSKTENLPASTNQLLQLIKELSDKQEDQLQRLHSEVSTRLTVPA